MKKKLRIINLVAFVVMIFINWFANYLPINGKTTGEVSESIPILFTPAPYVFSIWGVIYIFLACFIIYQFLPKQKTKIVFEEISFYFVLSSILNSLWIILWHYEQFYWNLVVMVGLLLTLIKIYKILNERKKYFNNWDYLFIYVPFSIYLAWISIALIANASIVLYVCNWNGFGLSDVTWTIIMIIVGLAIALYTSRVNDDLIFPLVFIWAYIGISVKQFGNEDTIAIVALISSIIMFVYVIYSFFVNARKDES